MTRLCEHLHDRSHNPLEINNEIKNKNKDMLLKKSQNISQYVQTLIKKLVTQLLVTTNRYWKLL